MSAATVIVMICSVNLPPSDCNKDTALTVMKYPALDEIHNIQGCYGAQPWVAGLAFSQDLGQQSYIKIACRWGGNEETP